MRRDPDLQTQGLVDHRQRIWTNILSTITTLTNLAPILANIDVRSDVPLCPWERCFREKNPTLAEYGPLV